MPENTIVVKNKKLSSISRLSNRLIINLRTKDETIFVENGITTVSISVLLSLAGECTFNMEEINYLFQKLIGLNYKQIFLNEKDVDFSALFHSPRIWRKIAELVCECLEIVQEKGLMNFLLLETKVTPILHQMFDVGFPLDVIGVRQECKNLRDTLSNVKKCIKESEEDVSELAHLCAKLEDKVRRIPCELNNRSKETYLFCNFRSLGSDTFRITTNHVNLQGLPKEIRKHLLPRYGEVLVEYDLVSSQLVILAYLSCESSLMEQYENGIDLYLFVISVITGRGKDNITETERNAFKKMLLQMLYGAGKRTIYKELKANGINVSCAEVDVMQDRFYKTFEAICKYSLEVKEAENLLLPDGRKWNLQESVDGYKRLAYVLQYMESLILREVLVLINEEFKSRKARLYLCIHDSIFIEAELIELSEVRDIVQRCFDVAMQRYLKGFKNTKLKEKLNYERFKEVFSRSKK